MRDFLAGALALTLGACAHPLDIESQPLNAFQVIGTHNSYKLNLEPRAASALAAVDPWRAVLLDYGHQTLTEQLDLGLRHLEIDILLDSNGGAYLSPMLGEEGTFNDPEMNAPGFKVLHIPDYDFRTTCATFKKCLREIERWSDGHPGHFPIFVHMNARTRSGGKWPEIELASELLDVEALRSIDAEARAEISDGKLLFASTVANVGVWPTLQDSRGRLLFFLDGSADQAKLYRSAFEPEDRRLVFTDAHDEEFPIDKYTVVLDAREDGPSIRSRVRDGFIVRTLGEFNTIEARRNERARFREAASSGAQVISIERYFEDESLRAGFVIDGFEGGGWVRCGPNHPRAPCAPVEDLPNGAQN